MGLKMGRDLSALFYLIEKIDFALSMAHALETEQRQVGRFLCVGDRDIYCSATQLTDTMHFLRVIDIS